MMRVKHSESDISEKPETNYAVYFDPNQEINMRISIQYEASWSNSFLDGSNNEPIPKNGRGFIGSMTDLSKRNAEGKCSNFIERQISLDKVMGILNRLIGDQRKLYQARQSPGYFFSEIESCVHYKNLQTKLITTKEMIFIRKIIKVALESHGMI